MTTWVLREGDRYFARNGFPGLVAPRKDAFQFTTKAQAFKALPGVRGFMPQAKVFRRGPKSTPGFECFCYEKAIAAFEANDLPGANAWCDLGDAFRMKRLNRQ